MTLYLLCRKFQLKVGGEAGDDIERIIAVREILDRKVNWILMSIIIMSSILPTHKFLEHDFLVILPETQTIELRKFEPGLRDIPLLCDANTGWLRHQAMQVVNGVKHLPNVYIEQPCLTYDECLSVRQHCPLPMVLDECMDDIGDNIPQCLLMGHL